MKLLMNKKITRWSLMNILFAILVSIPLWSIVVRTGYVLLNKNAYQSYSGTQEVYVKDTYNTNEVNNYNDLVNGNYYKFYFNDFNQNLYWSDLAWSQNDVITTRIFGFNLTNIDSPILDDTVSPSLDFNNNEIVVKFYLSMDSTVVYLFGINNDFNNYFQISFLNGEGNYFIIQYNQSIFSEFASRAFNSYHANFFTSIVDTDIAFPTFSKQNTTTLDNVFDYSIDKFNSENDAHFDFVSSIANMFITQDSYGWRYVEFVNWYFNYFIVISAVYILFLAIIWFIAVSRRLIERSMNLW